MVLNRRDLNRRDTKSAEIDPLLSFSALFVSLRFKGYSTTWLGSATLRPELKGYVLRWWRNCTRACGRLYPGCKCHWRGKSGAEGYKPSGQKRRCSFGGRCWRFF